MLKGIELKNYYLENLKYISVALFPVLALYSFLPLINIGYFVLFSIILFTMIKNRLKVKVNISITLIMFIFIVQNLIVGASRYLDIENTINNIGGMLIFAFLACFLCNYGYFDIEKLYTACKIISVIATFFLFYQFIAYNVFNTVVFGNLPFFRIETGGFFSISYGRPTSFFNEPAHYAIYITPVYTLSLIKKNYNVSIILLLGLIFSTSSTGILLAIITPI